MTHALHKLMTAAAAAALLLATPVYAQDSGDAGTAGTAGAAGTDSGGGGGGGNVIPSQDLDARVSPYKHELRSGFLGAQVPPEWANVSFDPVIGEAVPQDVTLAPVPADLIQARPDLTGYEYFMLPDERIVIVHPTERVVASVIDR